MGEVIPFPNGKPEGDISDTPLGKIIVEQVAKPVFGAAIDTANEAAGTDFQVPLDEGDWAVVPLEGDGPPNLKVV